MSDLGQTIPGKAYEYACLQSIVELVTPLRSVIISENSSLRVAHAAWESIPLELKQKMKLSSTAGVKALIELEPKITQDGKDDLELSLQPDKNGQEGDVRDVLIIRRALEWEIGISVKHNNEAVKHSRLSPTIDFGKDWFGLNCSVTYFEQINPIFKTLEGYKNIGLNWGQVSDKDSSVYVPILEAFMAELQRLDNSNPGIVPGRLLEYLLGRKDFYKLISNDYERTTTVQCFNLHGTLNTASSVKKPTIKVRNFGLPAHILYLGFKTKKDGNASRTTIQLVMDNDWGISLRLHSAKTEVENSLKFDIQLTGVPTSLFVNKLTW